MSESSDAELQATLARHLAQIGPGAGAPFVTLLQIGRDGTTVAWGGAGGAVSIERLALGSAHPGSAFRHDPPTPLDVEQAIAAVEDQVMPLARRIPTHSRLIGAGAALQALAASLPPQDAPHHSIDAIEHQFNELAAVVQGRPAAASGLTAHTGYAATLLILREFMHHLGFAAITIA